MIWKRAMASQMASAVYDQMQVNIIDQSGKIQFRATGSTQVFAGFMILYQEGKDDEKLGDDADKALPKLHVKDNLTSHDLQGH